MFVAYFVLTQTQALFLTCKFISSLTKLYFLPRSPPDQIIFHSYLLNTELCKWSEFCHYRVDSLWSEHTAMKNYSDSQ